MKTVCIEDPSDIVIASRALQRGELVVLPTETVYGLGGNIWSPSAIESIFRVKKRPQDNPLIIHIADIEQVKQLALEIPKQFYLLAQRFFPGPLTIVLKKHPQVSSVVSGGLNTVAIRMPSHPYALKLIQEAKVPIAAPSANHSGKPSPTSIEDVLEDLGGEVPYVIDGGRCEIGIESTVLSLVGKKPLLLRPGIILKEALEQVLGEKIAISHSKKALCPGMKYKHYSPRAAILVFSSLGKLQAYASSSPCKKIVLSEKPFSSNFPWIELSTKNLYFAYREADRLGYPEILIWLDKKGKSNMGLYNRILCSQSAFF